MSMRYFLPAEAGTRLSALIEAWRNDDLVSRIWQKDASVWTGSDEGKWLGWLDTIDRELASLARYANLRRDIVERGFSDIVLLGMGGSSLCPEVLAVTFGVRNFHILDSTVADQVRSLGSRLDLERTLFIVASKSGSTLEPNCFKQYFFDRVAQISDRPGRQFVAITDPGSQMEQVARDDGFRHIFYGEPTVGGRFSALSAFGMTAAAAMGLDIEMLLGGAKAMAEACREPDAGSNPGALLGLILGASHATGRDKLTILTSPELHDLGAWLEQLIAESTGKRGVAIIPVDREPQIEAGSYSRDRVFATVTFAGDTRFDALLSSLERSGEPVIRIDVDDTYQLGREFFRWEFATAVAGAVMGINPFDQPDVESAKIEARKLTDEYERTGALPPETPFYSEEGIELYADDGLAEQLKGHDGLREVLRAFTGKIGAGDYFALLAYIEMNAAHEEVLTSIRRSVLERTGNATCLGFGPRFLHSTGQAYKGGPNSGVFLQITADPDEDLAVPGRAFTFGVVAAAQARGDLQVLIDRGRRALRIHLTGNLGAGLARVAAAISD